MAPAPHAASRAPARDLPLAATMLASSAAVAPASPDEERTDAGASPAAGRAADAWNINAYLVDPSRPAIAPAPAPTTTPPVQTEPELLPVLASGPVDIRIRGGLASLLHRLPRRGIGVALMSALIVVVLGAGTIALLRGPLRSTPHQPVIAAPARKLPAAPAPAPVLAPAPRPPRAAAAPIAVAPPAPSPARAAPPVAPEPKKAELKTKPGVVAAKETKAREPAPEPEAAPPAPEESAPASHARPKTRAHAETKAEAKAKSKTKTIAKRSSRHASASPAPSRSRNHRTTAHAGAAEHPDAGASEEDRAARARDAYREGNERLFSGDAAGAITAYEEMVRLTPKAAAGYRGLGLASAQLGKRTEAVRYLRAYLKHAPNADDRAIIIGRISLLQTLP